MKRYNIVKKRVKTVFLIVIFMFSLCTYKIYSIQQSGISDVADMQFSNKYLLSKTRGYIYDINMEPLVNSNSNERIIAFRSKGDKLDGDIKIKDGLFICDDDSFTRLDADFSQKFTDIERYSKNQTCSHIIGYLDSAGNGICGIEKAYNKMLSQASGRLYLNYSSDASGRLLYGDGISLADENYNSPAGIRLTIDKNIQKIAENALISSEITTGAAVVLDVATAEIRAIASIPCYDINNLSEALNNEKMPFLNRALESYPVGSVFKPFVLAAALENGYSASQEYECKGFVEANGNTFMCYNHNAHGPTDANRAIEKSCNTYFINLGLMTGARKVIEQALLFGFSKEIRLCSTIASDNGNLPDFETISSDAELANICFGQGILLASPLQLAAAYNTLANNGVYIEPTLLKELIDEKGNAYAYYKSEDIHYALSKESCETINSSLYNNMLNGTGINGAPDNVSSAGKTATAQTGRYDESGKEILCTWFAGFLPYEEPEYTIVIFNENGSSASSDCAPVFKECAEKIYDYIKNSLR